MPLAWLHDAALLTACNTVCVLAVRMPTGVGCGKCIQQAAALVMGRISRPP
jgi:bacterioferritin-associated ferredoxin